MPAKAGIHLGKQLKNMDSGFRRNDKTLVFDVKNTILRNIRQ